MLKSGDTWNEALFPAGNGTYDTTTYSNTFSSTLSANTATYQGGSVYTNYHNKLLSDGMSDPAASNAANSYCVFLARADAIQAAHAAAFSSSTWNTITNYGVGAHPKISPGGSTKFGIRFGFNGGTVFTGGWKIVGVDIDACTDSGIDAEITGINPELRKAHGLWIEDCKLTNIAGMTANTSFPGADAGGYKYVPLWASAIATCHVEQIRVKNCEITSSDAPLTTFGGDGTWISGCNIHDTNMEGISIAGIQYDAVSGGAIAPVTTFVTPASNVLIESNTITNIGTGVGWAKGQAGIQFSNSRDAVVRNNTISNVHINSADGVGIDLEGWIAPDIGGGVVPGTFLIQSNTCQSGQGAGQLCNQSSAMDATSICIWDGNLFISNGNNGLPALLGMRTGISNVNMIFTSNDTTLVTVGQKLFAGDATHVYSPLTDTPPTGYQYGASNTKHFP